jgi:hypothetical protein
MQSSLLGLLITAILASASPRTPAATPPGQALSGMQQAEAQRRQYEADKSRCRALADGNEPACVLEARARYRAARDAR